MEPEDLKFSLYFILVYKNIKYHVPVEGGRTGRRVQLMKEEGAVPGLIRNDEGSSERKDEV